MSMLVTGMTAFIDNQMRMFAFEAFQVLSTTGSTLWIVLTAFITILVVFFGYNLLLGQALSARDGVLNLAKIGAITALATSWPAYQILVYDVVVDAPSQLSAEIGRRSGLPGSDGSLTPRLDRVDGMLIQIAVVGPGAIPPSTSVGVQNSVPPPPFASFNTFALGGARILFLITTIGALVSVRLVAGLMLVLGPFFIAFLMFSSTRSLFEGWVRVVSGAALGSLALSLTMGLQLVMLEPWLQQSLQRRLSGDPLPSLPSDIFVIISLFAILTMATLFAVVRLCTSFRMGTPQSSARSDDIQERQARSAFAVPESAQRPVSDRNRALVLAQHLAATQFKERQGQEGSRSQVLGLKDGTQMRGSLTDPSVRGLAPTRTTSSRTHQRVAASTDRRNATT